MPIVYKKVTPEARRLLEVLPATRREGAARLGVSDREFRRLVEIVKTQGIPIMSPDNGSDKYRPAETQAEVVSVINRLSHMAFGYHKQTNAIMKNIVIEGQVEMS